MQEVPEFHLTAFCDVLEKKIKERELLLTFQQFLEKHRQPNDMLEIAAPFKAKLELETNEHIRIGRSIKFLRCNLKLEMGLDAGGLSNDYFDSLFAGLINSSSLCFQELKISSLRMPKTEKETTKEQLWPSLQAEEQLLYQKMGQVVIYCNSYGSLIIGRHFDDALFHVIFSLTAQEINTPFENLPLTTKLKMLKTLLAAYEEQIYDKHIELLEKLNLTEGELLQGAQLAIYSECLPDEYISNNESPNREKILAHAYPDQLIKNALLEAVFGCLTSQGVYGTQLAPIHAMAQGMKSIYSLSKTFDNLADQYWDIFFLNRNAQIFSNRLQGNNVDRNKLINCFKDSEKLNSLTIIEKQEIRKKIEWLKNWLKDATNGATHEEIKKFIKFATGTSSLSDEVCIEFQQQFKQPFTPIPEASTCSKCIRLSPLPAGDQKSYHDHSAQGLIQCIKDIAFSQLSQYSKG